MAGAFACGLLLLIACPASVLGCSYVNKVVFSNWCSKDIYLDGWGQTISAGATLDITWSRPSSNRIAWKYTDGEQYDFIELNTYWTGPGSNLCGHPSYSNYNGFSMASKYEALNPDTGAFACNYPGAAITCHPDSCPGSAGGGYLCEGSTSCSSAYSNWMRYSCSKAINPDGTLTTTFKDTKYGTNYVDFWCSGVTENVATMIDCVANSVPIMFVITTCNGIGSLGNTTVVV